MSMTKIAGERTKSFINRVKSGDMTFGANDIKAVPSGPAAQIRTTITQLPNGAPAAPSLPPAPRQAPVNGTLPPTPQPTGRP